MASVTTLGLIKRVFGFVVTRGWVFAEVMLDLLSRRVL
jgi:hypothetical protein